MSVVYICDGCDKNAKGIWWGGRDVRWSAPQGWWQWAVNDTLMADYCSLECFENVKIKVKEKTGWDCLHMKHNSNREPISEKS